MTKLTVKNLFEKKGKDKLTELYVTNALEAYAAEKAGMYKIGVLTGLASHSDLAPYADCVLDNIGRIETLLT